MDIKRNIRNVFESVGDSRQMKYLGVMLADEQYNPEEIARYAIQKGYASRLGYLTEITLEAMRKLKLNGKITALERLVELLEPHITEDYRFLPTYGNSQFDKKLKELSKDKSNSPKNKKWNIYSMLTSADIEEYLQLYLIDLKRGNLVRIGKETIVSRE